MYKMFLLFKGILAYRSIFNEGRDGPTYSLAAAPSQFNFRRIPLHRSTYRLRPFPPKPVSSPGTHTSLLCVHLSSALPLWPPFSKPMSGVVVRQFIGARGQLAAPPAHLSKSS